ncbi:MAG: nickel-dependent hydrogenase large subunit [Gammaproteobacteria bacterium]|nr:nickel-dependent hydrogenase large subunit [Gammaproteobacteria bacterium]
MTDTPRNLTLNVPILARVEGEGALHLRIQDGELTQVQLQIYEPPRLFEKFLEGRHCSEVPDLVARICGICPVAYQISAVNALESLFETPSDPWIQAMRRLIYCGEWIESHALHIHLLALPDVLGYANVIEMARDHAAAVRRGLQLQHLGNALMALLGARSVHPVGVRLGGFHHAPRPEAVRELHAQISAALPAAEALVRWVATLDVPIRHRTLPLVALQDVQGYPLEAGQILVSDGTRVAPDGFEQCFEEVHVAHSTALHAQYRGQAYWVGPVARLALCQDQLPAATRALMASLPMRWPTTNPFHGMLARALEIHAALLEAQRLLADYHRPERAWQPVQIRAGTGFGVSEAPHGLLWHRYTVDAQGLIQNARIVPPTSQNQACIEDDLRQSLIAFGLNQPEDALRAHAEQVVRNYDPCISCATHFLTLRVERS